MLVLTFEDNEDDMMSRILSLINTREEVIQMSGMNNYLLSFKGLNDCYNELCFHHLFRVKANMAGKAIYKKYRFFQKPGRQLMTIHC